MKPEYTPEYITFRSDLARLIGICASAKALKEYGVPAVWIDGIIEQADKVEASKAAYFNISTDAET
jgi:hypothetical protein